MTGYKFRNTVIIDEDKKDVRKVVKKIQKEKMEFEKAYRIVRKRIGKFAVFHREVEGKVEMIVGQGVCDTEQEQNEIRRILGKYYPEITDDYDLVNLLRVFVENGYFVHLWKEEKTGILKLCINRG